MNKNREQETHINFIKNLLENKADVHCNNDAALMWASSNGKCKTVEMLLDMNADINARNGKAMELALKNKHYNTVRLLYKRLKLDTVCDWSSLL